MSSHRSILDLSQARPRTAPPGRLVPSITLRLAPAELAVIEVPDALMLVSPIFRRLGGRRILRERIDGWRQAAQFGYALGRIAKKDDREKPCRASAKKPRADEPSRQERIEQLIFELRDLNVPDSLGSSLGPRLRTYCDIFGPKHAPPAKLVNIGYDAIHTLIRHEAPEKSLPGILLAIASLVVMPLLARAKRRVASLWHWRQVATTLARLKCERGSVTF